MFSKPIGLVGFKSCGKGTVAKLLTEHYGYEEDSFAKPLKDACAAIFGWNRDMLEGATTESRAWREEVDEFWDKELEWNTFYHSREVGRFTPRLALQLMGTEAGRQIFGMELWTASLKKRIIGRKAVISDVRFPNEIETIVGMGGVVVEIQRGDNPKWYETASVFNNNRKVFLELPVDIRNIHESEREWIGNPKIDHLILNDFTLQNLETEVDLLMKVLNESL